MDSDPFSVAAEYPASPATKNFQRIRARIVVTIVEKVKRSLVLTLVIPSMRLINAREKPLRGWRLWSWPLPGKSKLRSPAKTALFQRGAGFVAGPGQGKNLIRLVREFRHLAGH